MTGSRRAFTLVGDGLVSFSLTGATGRGVLVGGTARATEGGYPAVCSQSVSRNSPLPSLRNEAAAAVTTSCGEKSRFDRTEASRLPGDRIPISRGGEGIRSPANGLAHRPDERY